MTDATLPAKGAKVARLQSWLLSEVLWWRGGERYVPGFAVLPVPGFAPEVLAEVGGKIHALVG